MRRIASLLVVALAVSVLGVARADNHYVKMTDVRVAMDDGVVMTADVYVPTIEDADGDDLYPCVVEVTPYRKESRYSEGASFLPAQGIALIEVDARGTGGSEGEYDIVFSVREQADAAAWVEWAATQAMGPDDAPLCEDTVGMYGGSYSGIIQYLVASLPETAQGDVPAAPPHLAAIAPQRAYGDLYRDIVYHGGQVIGSFGLIWSSGTSAYYLQPPTDIDTPAGQAAWLDHLSNNDPMMVPYLTEPFVDAEYTSDDSDPAFTQKLYEDSSALPRIENMRVPALHLAGWFDAFTRGQLLTFQRAHELEQQLGDRGPNFLIVGPWNHSGTHFITPDQGFREQLADWYGYWLEGEASGATAPAWFSEPRVRYFQMTTGTINAQSASDGAWRTTSSWPPSDAEPATWHLDNAGGMTRCNDVCVGVTPDEPRIYASNQSAGIAEILSRWDNAAGTPHPQHDQRLDSGKGLTYQTAALGEPLSIAGPVGLTLNVALQGLDAGAVDPEGTGGIAGITPSWLDTDFVVKLADVAPDGSVRLVTQGYLRASHRAYDPEQSVYIDGKLMSPFHLHTAAALDPPIAGEQRSYDIEIWPVAKTFAVGHRMRLDIYSADTPNHLTIVKSNMHMVDRSWLRLPVVE